MEEACYKEKLTGWIGGYVIPTNTHHYLLPIKYFPLISSSTFWQ